MRTVEAAGELLVVLERGILIPSLAAAEWHIKRRAEGEVFELRRDAQERRAGQVEERRLAIIRIRPGGSHGQPDVDALALGVRIRGRTNREVVLELDVGALGLREGPLGCSDQRRIGAHGRTVFASESSRFEAGGGGATSNREGRSERERS